MEVGLSRSCNLDTMDLSSRSCNLRILVKEDYRPYHKQVTQAEKKVEDLEERVNQISDRLDTILKFLTNPQFQFLEKRFKQKVLTDLAAPVKEIFQEIYPSKENHDSGVLENAMLQASEIFQLPHTEIESSDLNRARIFNDELPFLDAIRNLAL